jgi:hypothetical protein
VGVVTSAAYDIANSQDQKEPILVLEIEGSPILFTSGTIYTSIKYDDPGVNYDGTYVYDGMRPIDLDTQKSWIDRKGSSSTLSQKLEQWDGKASIETFNIKIVDVQGTVTALCSPGQTIEDILNRKVKVYFGYKTISYPEDYIKIFQGYINNVKIVQGAVFFTFTDPSSRRKQVLFNGSISRTTTALLSTDTVINLSSTDNLYRTILNAKGVADSTVTIGLVLDGSEICTFVNSGITSGTQVTVVRGQFGTTAVAHDIDVEVTMFMSVTDNPMNIALKSQLSGWDGAWVSGLSLRGIVNTDDSLTQADTITFSDGVDVVRDYGITLGSFVILSGSPNPANNGTFTVADIIKDNRTILVSETGILVQENPPVNGYLATEAAFRSQYDTYPDSAGLGLSPDDVLVSQFEYLRDVFVKFQFKMDLVAEESSGKTWIEQHLFKPIGGYSLTQGSKISVGLTHAPLINDLSKFIDQDNVINAKNIEVERGLNTRFFYNEMLFNYAYNPLDQKFRRSLRVINADAQSRMRQVSVLKVDCRGLADNPTSVIIMNQRAERILQRYQFAAETVSLSTNFKTGHTIDAGDVVILTDTDPPTLQIANTETGKRGVMNRVMEVQERTVDISNGMSKVTLLSNNGFAFSDRYGVIGPSSELDQSYTHTTTKIRIAPSFQMFFGNSEYKKWEDYENSWVKIHDKNYAFSANTTFTLDLTDPMIMHLSPALPFVPGGYMVVEFEDYDDTNAATNSLIKSTFVSLDPVGYIFSGSSSTVFTLQSGYSSRYQSGMYIYVMSPDGSRYSDDVKILSVVGDIVTVTGIFPVSGAQDLGFVPQSGDLVQLAGFKDSGSGYRLI